MTLPDRHRRLLLGGGLAALATGATIGPGRADAAPPSTAWALGGNLNVNTDGSNYLGPRNVAPLVLKTAATDAAPLERMRITPAGEVGIGTTAPTAGLDVRRAGGISVRAISGGTGGIGVAAVHSSRKGTAPGVQGETSSEDSSAVGVLGRVLSSNPGGSSAGVLGVNNGTGPAGIGVYGSQAGSGYGVYGETPTGYGLVGTGVYGAYALGGGADSVGVLARATGTSSVGVLATGDAYGVEAFGATGLYAQSSSGNAVVARATGTAIDASSSSSAAAGVDADGYVGLQGTTTVASGGQGVRGQDASGAASSYAGAFIGRVTVVGTLSKSAGSFKIDHPLDPAGKYLSHSFVESPDMKNLYDGVATLDADGAAVVTLPDWFEALNRDFRYQLTCVGGFANVYVAREVKGNRFTIAGGTPGLKVSWLVTGTRKDAYAEEHRIPVEEDKPAAERGRYLHPELFGKSGSQAVGVARRVAASSAGPDPAPPAPPTLRPGPEDHLG